MSEAAPKALGDIIEGYCSRCRLNLDVSVSALRNGAIAQVHCRTCGNFVAYKPPVDMEAKKRDALRKLMRLQEKKAKAEASAGAPAPTGELVARWQELTSDVPSFRARPYAPDRTFKAGDFLLHKAQGMGHVESAEGPGGCIVVLFRGGMVELPHGVQADEA